ncbi:hypothetical protein ABZ649_20090 [Streptomyces albidoflavus]|uniref:hypothetical protein n=1 Tax=Streptomyces albidoflavus TaxID=1886 RepID=UPI00340C2CB8
MSLNTTALSGGLDVLTIGNATTGPRLESHGRCRAVRVERAPEDPAAGGTHQFVELTAT